MLTLGISTSDVLEHLDMTRDLLARAKRAGLASNVISNELVPATRFAIDDDLLSSELWYQSDS